MKKKLLGLLAVTSTCFSLSTLSSLPQKASPDNRPNSLAQLLSQSPQYQYSKIPITPLNEIESMLRQQAPTLSRAVLNKVIASLKCAQKYQVEHNEVLTIIDYSLPSSEKRIWVFNLRDKKLLFHTYVSHGIRSGTLLTKYFSNKYNSKASSMGVYTTEQAYRGRDGLSLRLAGLDQGFNDNASHRAVVMHGGWYVEENFIKRYGRPGRSWGCPALPLDLTGPIINTIKNKAFLVIYYPNDDWFLKSRFLNCENFSSYEAGVSLETDVEPPQNETRDGILYVDMNRDSSREEYEPVVVISADNYERIFHSRPPLERMLRRQINSMEYIALTSSEFKNIIDLNNQNSPNGDGWNQVFFVVPDVKLIRGYYITSMRVVDLGKIKEAKANGELSDNRSDNQTYTVQTDTKQINLRSTSQFIRWLGL